MLNDITKIQVKMIVNDIYMDCFNKNIKDILNEKQHILKNIAKFDSYVIKYNTLLVTFDSIKETIDRYRNMYDKNSQTKNITLYFDFDIDEDNTFTSFSKWLTAVNQLSAIFGISPSDMYFNITTAHSAKSIVLPNSKQISNSDNSRSIILKQNNSKQQNSILFSDKKKFQQNNKYVMIVYTTSCYTELLYLLSEGIYDNKLDIHDDNNVLQSLASKIVKNEICTISLLEKEFSIESDTFKLLVKDALILKNIFYRINETKPFSISINKISNYAPDTKTIWRIENTENGIIFTDDKKAKEKKL